MGVGWLPGAVITSLYFVFALVTDAIVVAVFILYTPEAILKRELDSIYLARYHIHQDLIDLILLASTRLLVLVPFFAWARARYSTRRSVILSLLWVFFNFVFVVFKEVNKDLPIPL